MRDTAVLVIYSDKDFGGAERRLIRIYNEIATTRRCEIVVRGSTKDEFERRLEKADCSIGNIKKVHYFANNFTCLLNLLFFRRMSSVHYFDLCGFNQILADTFRIINVRTVLTIAFQNYAYGLMDEDEKRRLVKLINTSKYVDVLFPEGGNYLPTISKNKNISVTPGTFTNTEVFVPGKKEKLMLFAAARLEKDKNAELLIDAVKICADVLRKSEYKVLICGKDFEEDNLRKKVRDNGLQDIIEMSGYVKSSLFFPRTEVFFCLDLIDNYPSQTIAEAVSCGCGLICTDVGYSRRCGSEDFSTYVKNNPDELAVAIKKYVELSEEQKNSITSKARKYALEHYNIKESKEYFEGLLWC